MPLEKYCTKRKLSWRAIPQLDHALPQSDQALAHATPAHNQADLLSVLISRTAAWLLGPWVKATRLETECAHVYVQRSGQELSLIHI